MYCQSSPSQVGRRQPASCLWLPSLKIEKQSWAGRWPLSTEWSVDVSVRRGPIHFQTLGLLGNAQNIAPKLQTLASLAVSPIPLALSTFQLRSDFEGLST